MNQAVATTKSSPLVAMAERLSVDQQELQGIIMETVMPNNNVSKAQFVAFLAVANNYGLDPLKKEIFAFPGKGGAIQPIVSIDGWLTIIQSHPKFDGMELEEHFEGGAIHGVTCKIFRKDRDHPTVITEYLSECKRNTDPWNTKPIRMLRHKAVIQCGRYAFGLGGIMEQDEFEQMMEKEVNPDKANASEATRTASVKQRLLDDEEEAEDAVTEPLGEVSPAPEPEQSEPAMTFADVAEAINTADKLEKLAAVGNVMVPEFLGQGDNGQFKDELTALYKSRQAELKAIADEQDQ